MILLGSSCLLALGTLHTLGGRILGCHFVIAAIFVALLGCTARRPQFAHFVRLTVLSIPLLLGAVILGASGGFDRLGMMAWIALIYLPSYGIAGAGVLLGAQRLARGQGQGIERVAPVYVGLALSILGLGVGLWSTVVEPRRLEISRFEISSDRLERSYTVMVLADLQAGKLGAYERRALEVAREAEVDVILWAGDYLQTPDPALYRERAQTLNRWLRELNFQPRMGSFAVQGNVDWTDHWSSIFEGQSVHCFTKTEAIDLAPDLQLVGLSQADSRRPVPLAQAEASPSAAESESSRLRPFQIVLGHHPDFMKHRPGDLLISGHTHGGQVQLPLLGPLLNPSTVSKTLAAGGLFPKNDQHLLISRGIGVERGAAPPLRFNCRPEIIIVTLRPSR